MVDNTRPQVTLGSKEEMRARLNELMTIESMAMDADFFLILTTTLAGETVDYRAIAKAIVEGLVNNRPDTRRALPLTKIVDAIIGDAEGGTEVAEEVKTYLNSTPWRFLDIS